MYNQEREKKMARPIDCQGSTEEIKKLNARAQDSMQHVSARQQPTFMYTITGERETCADYRQSENVNRVSPIGRGVWDGVPSSVPAQTGFPRQLRPVRNWIKQTSCWRPAMSLSASQLPWGFRKFSSFSKPLQSDNVRHALSPYGTE